MHQLGGPSNVIQARNMAFPFYDPKSHQKGHKKCAGEAGGKARVEGVNP
jgi:hypothetical protein